MTEENEMMVFLTGETVTADLYTTDEVIALNTDNQLKAVKNLIRNHKADLEEFGKVHFQNAPLGNWDLTALTLHIIEQICKSRYIKHEIGSLTANREIK